jgi:protein-L-isoaspartate(D-aspartate) O-methyltransferase
MNAQDDAAEFAALRLRMVERQLRARGISEERVLAAMARVPRHELIAGPDKLQAYEDYPLPIGQGQTISQPFMVALMLQLLALQPSDRALEIGTGSGYVTALLAELTARVVSIERHSPLAEAARAALSRLGYLNTRVIAGDGTQGFAEEAPYDAILVSAAAHEIPPALLAQLGEGGRMVIPIGSADSQQLLLVRIENGRAITSWHELCRFVPLVAGSASKPS